MDISATSPAAHPPKREVFDVPAMTNIDPKGYVRGVRHYEVTDFGLYMSRSADHHLFTHLQSWLLPHLGLRANIFHFVDGHRPDQRLYLDVGEFSGPDGSGRWFAEDWYLDLIDRPGQPLELVDVDELFDAHAAGYMTTGQCVRAVHIANRTLIGSTAHRDNVEAWLAASGAPLTWSTGA